MIKPLSRAQMDHIICDANESRVSDESLQLLINSSVALETMCAERDALIEKLRAALKDTLESLQLLSHSQNCTVKSCPWTQCDCGLNKLFARVEVAHLLAPANAAAQLRREVLEEAAKRIDATVRNPKHEAVYDSMAAELRRMAGEG